MDLTYEFLRQISHPLVTVSNMRRDYGPARGEPLTFESIDDGARVFSRGRIEDAFVFAPDEKRCHLVEQEKHWSKHGYGLALLLISLRGESLALALLAIPVDR